MADRDDVRRAALALPETAEAVSRGLLQWRVADRLFVWERPLRKPDLAALGRGAPDGAILGARVEDEGEKRALIEAEPELFFTIPHFAGYPAILTRLDSLGIERLGTLVTEAWLARAPTRLARTFLAGI